MILKEEAGQWSEQEDRLAVEEPLAISLQYLSNGVPLQKMISVTMRTPGQDAELAAGFLFTEGIVSKPEQVKLITPAASGPNTILVILDDGVSPALNSMERNFYTTSSCGVCGKASIDALRSVSAFRDLPIETGIRTEVLHHLPDMLKDRQRLFDSTGGIHASALFDMQGNFIDVAEDVGRHNALDKLIGSALIGKRLPWSDRVLLLSGRASFELVQKAYMAGLRIIAAVGAPSSLAVELAAEHGITLIGFLRNSRMNVYSGKQRIIDPGKDLHATLPGK